MFSSKILLFAISSKNSLTFTVGEAKKRSQPQAYRGFEAVFAFPKVVGK